MQVPDLCEQWHCDDADHTPVTKGGGGYYLTVN